jgi:YfiH family protein
MVRTADCVPVLLAAAEAGVIGAAHAGRAGMVGGVVPASVERMRALGAREITAWIGPSICGRCYEVPRMLRDEVARVEPVTAATTKWGTPAIDVAAGVRVQLERAGVDVQEATGCTRERADLYSYRRDGPGSGRQAGVIVRRVS